MYSFGARRCPDLFYFVLIVLTAADESSLQRESSRFISNILRNIQFKMMSSWFCVLLLQTQNINKAVHLSRVQYAIRYGQCAFHANISR